MRLIDADSFDYGIIKYMPKSLESVEYDAEVRAYRNAERIVKAGGVNG